MYYISTKIQQIALKTYIALYSSKLIHRNRCRKGQSGPVLRVVRHTRSVKKCPLRGQIPFSTLSSPPSHPPAMQGFPSLSLASLTLEKRTAGNTAMNTATNKRIPRMWHRRRSAMKDVKALNEEYQHRLLKMSKRA